MDGGSNVALDGSKKSDWILALFSENEHVVAPGKGQSRSLTDAVEEVLTII